ncbi:hypothetical protein [Microcoleus sp. B9-D4]|uniref:hypothetical protein n=1 Tax=Microcoleus sp. B9-D4 TaxID=2818711 RepID=UPI002FD1561B
MDKYSYRFTIASLNVSVIMLVAAGAILVFQKENTTGLIPFLAPILTLLGGLVVSPPKPQSDHR